MAGNLLSAEWQVLVDLMQIENQINVAVLKERLATNYWRLQIAESERPQMHVW